MTVHPVGVALKGDGGSLIGLIAVDRSGDFVAVHGTTTTSAVPSLRFLWHVQGSAGETLEMVGSSSATVRGCRPRFVGIYRLHSSDIGLYVSTLSELSAPPIRVELARRTDPDEPAAARSDYVWCDRPKTLDADFLAYQTSGATRFPLPDSQSPIEELPAGVTAGVVESWKGCAVVRVHVLDQPDPARTSLKRIGPQGSQEQIGLFVEQREDRTGVWQTFAFPTI